MLEFQWDEANTNHIARHNVTPDEFELVFAGCAMEIDVQYEHEEGRFLWMGETRRGRILAVVFTERGGRIRQ